MSQPHAILAAIGMGSNLGDRTANLARALHAIARIPDSSLARVSTIIQTPAWGPVTQAPYLNGAALLRTDLPARRLLTLLHSIERDGGRDRAGAVRYGPRTIDLDLLLYGDCLIDEPGMTVPHPRLRERRFVLVPLTEIAPDWLLPDAGITVREALAALGSEAP